MIFSYLNPKCVAQEDPQGGCGVFATDAFRAAELVSLWGGVIIHRNQLDPTMPRFTQRVLQVDEDLYLITAEEKEPNDCFNHSCEPNLGFLGQIGLVAMRDIKAGEQLMFDYAMSDGGPYDEFECFCGSGSCRGKVTGSDWKLPNLWKKYDGYFSPYLERRIKICIRMNRLIGERPQFDRNIVIITVVSTLLLIVDRYQQITKYKYFDRLILYLIVPMIVTLVIFRSAPKEHGFTFGDWRTGMILTIGGIIFLAPIIWYLGRNDLAMKSYYSGFEVGLPWTTFLDLIGWEFFFRGWILFGYARRFGPEAIWLQAVPFAMAHIGKPEIETISTIFGGFAFGWVAWRTKSFVWPFLIHWFIATFIILVAAGVI